MLFSYLDVEWGNIEKDLYMAYDRVTRCYVMSFGKEMVQDMYDKAVTSVRISTSITSEFPYHKVCIKNRF